MNTNPLDNMTWQQYAQWKQHLLVLNVCIRLARVTNRASKWLIARSTHHIECMDALEEEANNG